MAVGEHPVCPSDSTCNGAFSRTTCCSCNFPYFKCYEKLVLDAKTLWSDTCCCLMAWALLWAQFSSGIGEPHVLQTLFLSQELSIEV